MRAWTIVIFILAFHVCLAMVNYADITDVGLNITFETSGGGVLVSPGTNTINMPSSTLVNPNATSKDDALTNQSITLKKGDFVGDMMEIITGVATPFFNLMTTFSKIVFSIHYLCTPYFGDFNSWMLEAMVDFIFVMALFQMVTGRSFKTME
jgi:hypothetical protein